MSEGLFRKKSMEKFSSPEQLNDYIRVTNPSVWVILGCVIVLLAGMCAWGIFGRFESKLTAAAVCSDGKLICYVGEDSISDVKEGMTVRVGDEEYSIKSLASSPVKITDDFDEYLRHIGSLKDGEWVYEAEMDVDLDDGTYEAEIITESVSPISFLMN